MKKYTLYLVGYNITLKEEDNRRWNVLTISQWGDLVNYKTTNTSEANGVRDIFITDEFGALMILLD